MKGWLLPRYDLSLLFLVTNTTKILRNINKLSDVRDHGWGFPVGEEEKGKDAFSSNICEICQLVIYFLQLVTYFRLHVLSSHFIQT